MPKIEVSRTDLFTLAGIGDPGDETLKDLLSFVKGELDNSDGDMLKIELNDTNRPDLWCVEGIARALRCRNNAKSGHLRELKVSGLNLNVSSELKEIRPFIAAFTAEGWSPTERELESLIEVQEKLGFSFGKNRKTAAIGFYRLDDIEFPVEYTAVSTDTAFIPLGEESKFTLAGILKTNETGKKYAYILEKFDKYPLLTDRNGLVLSFPPVINSRATGQVEAGDSRLFCEVTGTDWETVQLTCTILACNLEDRGAEISSVEINYPYEIPSRGKSVVSPVIFSDTLRTTLNDVERVLGISMSENDIVELLLKMDYESARSAGGTITGVLPPYRHDGIHPVDMIEDIAISLGYSVFKPLELPDFTVGESAYMEDLADALRLILVGTGCEEILRPVLGSFEKTVDISRTPENPVAISNPMTTEYGIVRNSLLPGLLEVESKSARSVYPHRLFEVGEILKTTDDQICFTTVNAGILICDNNADFGDAHSIIGAICYARNLELSLVPTDDPRFIQGRCAHILVNGIGCGILGEIHPVVLTGWGISTPASAFEVDITALKG